MLSNLLGKQNSNKPNIPNIHDLVKASQSAAISDAILQSNKRLLG